MGAVSWQGQLLQQENTGGKGGRQGVCSCQRALCPMSLLLSACLRTPVRGFEPPGSEPEGCEARGAGIPVACRMGRLLCVVPVLLCQSCQSCQSP